MVSDELKMDRHSKTLSTLAAKHILLESTHLRDTLEKFFAVSAVETLFQSVDNHTIIAFTKKHIFITNCNVCYFNSMLAL